VFPARVHQELEQELRFHLERQIQENTASGMAPDEAQYTARRSFGSVAQIEQQCRDAHGLRWIEALSQDLRYAVRSLRRAPVFALVVVITLGLGIGANTAMFTIADALLMKALPVKDPGRLFQFLQPDGPGLREYANQFPPADYRQMKGAVAAYAELAAESEVREVGASIDGAAEETLRRAIVSPNYFRVLGVDAAIGTGPVAVISDAFWKRRFGADPRVLGRTVRIANTGFQIVSIAQPRFFGLDVGTSTDMWTPLGPEPEPQLVLRLIGRPVAGATAAQALGPAEALFHQHMVEMVGHAPPGTPPVLVNHILGLKIKVIPAGKGISSLRTEYGDPVWIVLGLVALVLLVACTGIAILFEARSRARQREMAVRASLGANRASLARQVLSEAMLLTGLAAALGLALARWVSPLLVSLLGRSGEPVDLPLGIDNRVLAFTTVVSALTALVFGVLPAWRVSRIDLNSALKSGSPAAGSGRPLAARFLVGFQVAVSLVLILGATLFVRTLAKLSTMDTGFDRRNVILANIQYRGTDRGGQLSSAWEELRHRISTAPGVESVSLSSGSAFTGAWGNGMLRVPGVRPEAARSGCVFFRVSDGFFRTAGIALLKGRDFEGRDFDAAAPAVAVISQSVVRQIFEDADPIGRTLSNFEDNPPRWITVIGVVSDTRFKNLRSTPPLSVYLPYTWPQPLTSMSLLFRAGSDLASLAAVLRQETRAAAPDFTIRRMTTESMLIDDSLVRERLLAAIGSLFGVLALVMAAVGLFGVTSYTVAQRTREIGIRMALGCTRGAVVRMVLAESGLVAGLGVGIGLAAAQCAGRLVSALLFGVSAHDPGTLAITVSVMVAATGIAAWIPACRAANADPTVALRND
jgi:predicted permease